jgi:hypothetical protein
MHDGEVDQSEGSQPGFNIELKIEVLRAELELLDLSWIILMN